MLGLRARDSGDSFWWDGNAAAVPEVKLDGSAPPFWAVSPQDASHMLIVQTRLAENWAIAPHDHQWKREEDHTVDTAELCSGQKLLSLGTTQDAESK